MRVFILGVSVLVCLCAASISFSASGDRTPAGIAKFHIISSSGKSTCTRGEFRVDKTNVYVCQNYSTTVYWKKLTPAAF